LRNRGECILYKEVQQTQFEEARCIVNYIKVGGNLFSYKSNERAFQQKEQV
jgi:hypothetical protein